MTIECSEEVGLLDALDAARPLIYTPRRGRKFLYCNESLLRVVVLRMLSNREHNIDFLNDLKSSKQGRIICGIASTPSAATYSRFLKVLAALRDLLWQVMMAVNLRINAAVAAGRETGGFADDTPPLGEILAIDSTDIPAYSVCRYSPHIDTDVKKSKNPERCKSPNPDCCARDCVDPDAQWGFKTNKNAPNGKGLCFGYKLHAIVDAYYGTVLHVIFLPANESDTDQLIPLMSELLKMYPRLAPKYLLADKGYDSVGNCVWLDSKSIIPIIAVRRPREDNEENRRHEIEIEGPYGRYIQEVNFNGYLVCAGNRLMEYAGTDAERGHLFRCAKGGCRLNKKTMFPIYCEGETWVKPEGKALRVIGRIPQFTKRWKRLYRLRQTVERFFSSAKRSRLMNVQKYLTMGKVDMHAAMSVLSYGATMLARLLVGDYERMRHMRV
ncbi:MAG: transposase [Chloroflexi bacterium]|nr:transposase [Chloroflexota bacterium]